MFNELKALFAELTGGTKHPARFGPDDIRVAAAALMVHVATLDGDLTPTERGKLRDLLKTRFKLDEAATAELIEAAVAADREAIDFYQFTSLLMRMLDEEQRRRIIAMMWEMVFADGSVTEFEDNVIWRVADLLGVSNRERIELRRAVAGGAGTRIARPDRGRLPHNKRLYPCNWNATCFGLMRSASQNAEDRPLHLSRMSKPVLLILHQEHSTPGRVGHHFKARGVPVDMRRPASAIRCRTPSPITAGVVVFGGPMSANDPDDFVRHEIDWLAVPLKERSRCSASVSARRCWRSIWARASASTRKARPRSAIIRSGRPRPD